MTTMRIVLLLCISMVPLGAQMASLGRAHKNYVRDPNCVGAWLLNTSGTSQVEWDSSGHTSSLVASAIPGSSASVPPGYVGYSKTFAAANSHQIWGPDYSSLDINGASATITITAWVYATAAPASGQYAGIAAKWYSATGSRQYGLHLYGTGSSQFQIQAFLRNNADSASTTVSSTLSTYALNTWYHVAFVSNNTTASIYVNGALASSQVAHTGGIANGDQFLYVGKAQYGGNWFLTGLIDELAVFNRALSLPEIQEIREHGLTGLRGTEDTSVLTNSYTVYYDVADAPTYDDYITDLAALCTANPSWTCSTIGTTVEGRAIKLVVIAPGGYTTTVMIDGALHGNEKTGAVTAIGLLHYLAAHPTMFPAIRWVIVPIANPDGYNYNGRKNRNLYGGSSTGVDLNRNFDRFWGQTCSYGANPSTNPLSAQYQGPSAHSEAETVALQGVLTTYAPNYYFALHSTADTDYSAQNSQTQKHIMTAGMIQGGFMPWQTWYYDSATCGQALGDAFVGGANAHTYEAGAWSNREEGNRGIAALLKFAGTL